MIFSVSASHTSNVATCSSTIGITPTVNPASPIPEGTSNISVTFQGGITPGQHYRLRFDSVSTDYVTAVNNGVIIPIANRTNSTINSKLRRGPHTSTLEYSTNALDWHDLCGNVQYTVGFRFTTDTCRLNFSPPEPADNQQFTVTATDTPTGQYSIVVRGSRVGSGDILNVGATGVGSVPIGPISQLGPSPIALVAGYLLPTQIIFCGTTVNIVASGGATPPIGCSIIPPSTPGGKAKILATNINQNTFYHARLDNNFTSQDNTRTNTSLELSLGSNIPPGPHTGSVHDLSGQNVCPAGSGAFTIAGTGIVTPSLPTGPGATAGGLPCGTTDNPGFKTAIGCIHTNPVALTKDLLKFGLGIAGGLAFLMMLLGVFQMLTSAGNPETLATGKDRLTNAVIGLLFVIFSVLLLQIIGIGILDIPGFGR